MTSTGRGNAPTLRLLEGEVVVYNGLGWIVKGYQHPEKSLIAYPRYDLLNRRKLGNHEVTRLVEEHAEWWGCLKLKAPLLPLVSIAKYRPAMMVPSAVEEITWMLELSPLQVEVSGSYLVNPEAAGDIDVVVYGATNEVADRIRLLIERGVFKRPSLWILYKEYTIKHVGVLDVETYLASKSKTILSLTLGGKIVNLRLYRYKRGFNTCTDPVESRRGFKGLIELTDQANPVLPSRRKAVFQGGEAYFETHRELYAELPPGLYYVEGDLEVRKSGVYIVADRGRVVGVKGGVKKEGSLV
jgi:hypothetical protein